MLSVAAMSLTGRVTSEPYHLHEPEQQAATFDRKEAAACNLLLEVTSKCADESFQRLFAFGAAVLHQNTRFGKCRSSRSSQHIPRLPELCFCLNELYHWPLLNFATLSAVNAITNRRDRSMSWSQIYDADSWVVIVSKLGWAPPKGTQFEGHWTRLVLHVFSTSVFIKSLCPCRVLFFAASR